MSSDEIAADFKDCLNDLQLNVRHEISNLTIIAKENIEHAQALSRTLENHIRTTAPTKKLPALYVLDSIVKNVGSPYTIYLGRNLFSTFMDAYTLVDANTRRSMESMLKTWKEPVPGSMEPTPVFPFDTTRVIENALMKARNLAMQRAPNGPQQFGGHRASPTPPQHMSRYGLPPTNPPSNGHMMPHYQNSSAANFEAAQSLLASLSGHSQPQPQNDKYKLDVDINALIEIAKTDFAQKPYDTSIQQRLKALVDLQTIVRTQNLSPEAINAIKTQVASLSAVPRPVIKSPPMQARPLNHSSWQPPSNIQPNLSQFLVGQQQPIYHNPVQTIPQYPPGSLEALLSNSAQQAQPNPTMVHQVPTPVPNVTQAQSLIDALRAAGVSAANSITGIPPFQATQSTSDLFKSLSNTSGLNNSIPPILSNTGTLPVRPRLALSQANLKGFEPTRLSSLYTSLPSRCPICALRFPTTEQGKSLKARHLDWHFRTNQRVADTNTHNTSSGLHRLWYVNEITWVKAVELDISLLTDDDTPQPLSLETPDSKSEKKKRVERKYVLAPAPGKQVSTDSGKGRNTTCPICQESFTPEWDENVQEWLWYDVVETQGRVYHQTCLDEISKGINTSSSNGNEGSASGVLGKRKAEDEHEDKLANLRARLKTGV